MFENLFKLIRPVTANGSRSKKHLHMQSSYPSVKDNSFVPGESHREFLSFFGLDGIKPADCYYSQATQFVGFSKIPDQHVMVFPVSVLKSTAGMERIRSFALSKGMGVGLLDLTTNAYCKDLANNQNGTRAIIIPRTILKPGAAIMKAARESVPHRTP